MKSKHEAACNLSQLDLKDVQYLSHFTQSKENIYLPNLYQNITINQKCPVF